MVKNLEAQKAKLKENINKEIDGYFANLESSKRQGDFDINKLEKLMIENQQRVKIAINETTSEVASNVETSEKKLSKMWKHNKKF